MIVIVLENEHGFFLYTLRLFANVHIDIYAIYSLIYCTILLFNIIGTYILCSSFSVHFLTSYIRLLAYIHPRENMRRYFLQKRVCAHTPAHFYYVNMYVHNQHFMTNYEFTPWFSGSRI